MKDQLLRLWCSAIFPGARSSFERPELCAPGWSRLLPLDNALHRPTERRRTAT